MISFLRAAGITCIVMAITVPANGQTATLVKDINAVFKAPAGSSPYGIVRAGPLVFFAAQNRDLRQRALLIGSTIYFNADDGQNGYELWKSDGTTAGTVMIARRDRAELAVRLPAAQPSTPQWHLAAVPSRGRTDDTDTLPRRPVQRHRTHSRLLNRSPCWPV